MGSGRLKTQMKTCRLDVGAIIMGRNGGEAIWWTGETGAWDESQLAQWRFEWVAGNQGRSGERSLSSRGNSECVSTRTDN